MKFLPHGPNIPADLVAAQEKGQVIFVCGAGVSRMVGLPLFRGLVESVYERLGENWADHIAEREGMAEDGRLYGQYDRVLRCLERRLAPANVGNGRRMRVRIRGAVRDSLRPAGPVDLANHLALLELSRDADGSTRLLTTNFDTQFERAWKEKFGEAISSFAGPAMPQPKTAVRNCVLHLHGRLVDDDLGLDETALVLTSAEFGDAYLRSGWASRYMYDLVRAYTVVLVGYEADDPPMRYLLEALEEDRDRYPDLQKVYAFASCEPGQESISEALWKAKAIEPILYSINGGSHDALYQTLQEWQTYAKDPTDWRRTRLRTLLSNDPKAEDAGIVDECVVLLSHGDASQLLGELSPSADWLPILMQNRVFDNKKASPGRWIAAGIDNPDIIRACAARGRLDEETEWFVKRALEKDGTKLSPVRRDAWRLILKAKRENDDDAYDMRWVDAQRDIKAGEVGFSSRHIIAEMLRPNLVVERKFSWREEVEPRGPETMYDLLRLDFKAAQDPHPEEILSVWPNVTENEVALFKALDRALIDALEEAEDVGFLADWDRADHDVPSVGKHKQNEYRNGFYPIVRGVSELADRILAKNADAIRANVVEWAASRFALLQRLALYAMVSAAFKSEDVAHYIMSLDDRIFWVGGAQVEIMRLLLSRWPDFDPADRARIEARLRSGPPRTLFREDAFNENDKWESVWDSAIYRRLSRLHGSALALAQESRALLTEISGRHPKWKPGPGDRDDFHSWHESHSGPQGEAETLRNIPDANLVSEALRIQQERFFDHGDLWRVFCAKDPERALRGLTLQADNDEWKPEAWRCLLWAAAENTDVPFQFELASQLLRMPDAPLRELLSSTTSWLQKKYKILSDPNTERGQLFFLLWDRFAHLSYDDSAPVSPDDRNDDLSTRSLNEPGGILAWSLVDIFAETEPQKDSEIGGPYAKRFTRIANAPGRPGLLGRVYLVRNLAYLDYVAPTWTAANLLPKLSWDHPEALVLWEAYASSHQQDGTPRLFNALKPALIRAFERPELSDEFEGPMAYLLSIALWHQQGQAEEFQLTAVEIRGLLARAPQSLLQNVSWQFWHLMMDAKAQIVDKAERWRRHIGPLFRSIWPLDGHLRSERVSQNLVNMALECEAAFPDAVDAVLDFVIPYRLYSISHSLRLDERHEYALRDHTASFLKLANALIDPKRYPIPRDLAEVLDVCVAADPKVVSDPEYRRLFALRRGASA